MTVIWAECNSLKATADPFTLSIKSKDQRSIIQYVTNCIAIILLYSTLKKSNSEFD